MSVQERRRHAHPHYLHTNWVAIFSYSASVALSLAIWGGMYRAVEYLVK
jgi:hypothetical protein